MALSQAGVRVEIQCKVNKEYESCSVQVVESSQDLSRSQVWHVGIPAPLLTSVVPVFPVKSLPCVAVS